jgi:hypothetical protein
MKFFGFKEFRQDRSLTLDDLIEYLSIDLKSSLRELTTGLRKLTFDDNFESFEVDVTIPAGTELAIRNELKSIPTRRIILATNLGGLDVYDGDTEWTTDFLYLTNSGASTAQMKVVFLI